MRRFTIGHLGLIGSATALSLGILLVGQVRPSLAGAATNAFIAPGSGAGTIADDDPPPFVSIADASVIEGDSGYADAIFHITLSAASGKPTSVELTMADWTATGGVDYGPYGAIVDFAAGETIRDVTVFVGGDRSYEGDERFTVTLTNPTDLVIDDGTATGLILDDDAPPTISIDDVRVTEGNGVVTHALVAVSLSPPAGVPVSVNYATADGTATAVDDYAPDAATLVFAPGQVEALIDLGIVGDGLDEPDETLTVNLSSPTNATIADAVGEVTILDDDALIEISISDWAGGEGNSGTLPAAFTVTLSQPSPVVVTVDYVAGGIFLAANPIEDFLPASGTLAFGPGETTKTVTVEIVGDRWVEASENFGVFLSNAMNAVIADDTGLGGIFDDDLVLLQVGSVNVTEGDSGTTPATFTISPLDPLPYDLEVDYRTIPNIFTSAGVDFVPTFGTFTLSAGATSYQVTVDVIGDTDVEVLEGFVLEVTNGPYGITSIVDDDQPRATISDASVTEGAAGTATFSVNLDRPSIFPITVDFASADGSARATSFLNPNFGDYTAASGTLTFAAGETSKVVVVDVLDDVIDEDDETFTLELSNASNATIADASGTGTIVDNDAQPTLVIEDAIFPEGSIPFLISRYFHVTLSAPTERLATVDIAVTDGTATSPDDFTGGSGSFFIQRDVTEFYVLVFVGGDTIDEDNETFNVDLTNGTNITIVDGHAVGTIDDDDPIQTISIDNVSVIEGDSGTTPVTFTVSLSAPRLLPVTVDYATLGLGATPGSDFLPTVGTVTFAPGETVKTITAEVVGDTEVESDEAFGVVLSHAILAVIDQGQGTATIVDDDVLPAASIDDVDVLEGNTGLTPATFTISLSEPSAQTATVDWATQGISAFADGDYHAAFGTATFAPGDTSETVTIDVVGDSDAEGDEQFSVRLFSATNASILDDTGIATIRDDDAATISIGDASIAEGNTGTARATFTVSLSEPSPSTVSVDFSTFDNDALHGIDFGAASGVVTFLPGDVDEPITVDVYGDTAIEADETFYVVLANSIGASIGDGVGLGTIVNDDVPAISIGDVNVTEGTGGTTQAALTVELSAPSTVPVTVGYATADSSATSPADFTAASGTLTFNPGETAREIRIDVVGDALDEASETFAVDLANATNATIADAFAIVTITDDDAPPGLCVDDAAAIEGDSGTTPLVFTICLSAPSGKPVSVNFASANGTAAAGTDYTATTGTATMPPGTTTASVTVPVRGDVSDEVNETFTLNLSNPVNATIADPAGVGTIVDDDPKPVITSFQPAGLPQGATVTIRGSGFSGATQVAFARAGGGTVNAATFNVVNDGRLTATVPPLAATGRVSITTPAGTGTGPANLLIEPRITGFTPAAGPVGTVVTINGTAFTGTTAVRFGQTTATAFTVVSDTQIRATVPVGARTGKIEVVTPGGNDSSVGKFTVQ